MKESVIQAQLGKVNSICRGPFKVYISPKKTRSMEACHGDFSGYWVMYVRLIT
jgi:hypothetical protein